MGHFGITVTTNVRCNYVRFVARFVSFSFLFFNVQALSLYHDASDLCRRALKRQPISAEDVAFFKDTASLASSRAQAIEEALVATVECQLLAKNGIIGRRPAVVSDSSGGVDNSADWLRKVMSRCSESSIVRGSDHDEVATTDNASLSSSSTSSLTGTG